MSTDNILCLADAPGLYEDAGAFADAAIGRVRLILGREIEIHHIGATAVPGCLTKGDVDLAVRVDDVDFAAMREMLDEHYEKNLDSPRDASFASYTDDAGAFPLGIQLVVRGSEHDTFHHFADRLRDSRELLASYNALKRSFAGADMEVYRKAKAEFIARSLAGAAE